MHILMWNSKSNSGGSRGGSLLSVRALRVCTGKGLGSALPGFYVDIFLAVSCSRSYSLESMN